MSKLEELQQENTELKDEVERLKSKNSQLLSEKKRAGGDAEGLQKQLEEAEKQRDDLASKLHHLTVELPREELMRSVTVSDDMADTALREILHHFDVVEEEGKQLFKHKDGRPVEVEKKGDHGDLVVVPLEMNERGIYSLYDHGLLPALGHMLKGSQATGGGAPGSDSGYTPTNSTRPKTSQSGQFGLR